MTTYQVTHESPPRYFIQGAESDSDEEVDRQKNLPLRTLLAAEKILSDKANSFELEIKFKNIFKPPIDKKFEAMRQVMRDPVVEFNPTIQQIICRFTPTTDQKVFFSYNHQARYSKATLFLKGPITNGDRIAMDCFTTYFVPDPKKNTQPEYRLCSDTLSFRAHITPINEEMKKELKGPVPPKKVQRALFPSPEEPTIISPYSSIDNELKLGAIFYIEKALVQLRLNNDLDPTIQFLGPYLLSPSSVMAEGQKNT